MSRVDVILKQMKHSEPKCMQEKKKKKKKKHDCSVRTEKSFLLDHYSASLGKASRCQNSDPRAEPLIHISQCKNLIVVELLWRNFLAGWYREV